MRRSNRIIIGAAALVGIQLLIFALYHALQRARSTHDRPETFEYEATPNVTAAFDVVLEKSDGSTFQLRRQSHRPVLLHFWATWCEPCRKELPVLLKWSETATARRGEVLLISLDENWAAISHFFDGNIPPVVVREPAGELRQAYGVSTLPVTYVLRSGGVVARIQGARNWDSNAAQQVLTGLFRR